MKVLFKFTEKLQGSWRYLLLLGCLGLVYLKLLVF